jgi:hypothetical protein
MELVYCEAHTPGLEAAGKSGAHEEIPECVWPHYATPSGRLPQVGHPLRSTD